MWYLFLSRRIFTAKQTPCVLCGGESFTKLAEGNRYGFPLTVYTCTECGMSMQQPYPTNAFLTEFYTKDYYRGLYWGTHTQSEDDRNKRRKFMGERLTYLASRVSLKDKAVLDYGAGTKVLAEIAAPYDAKVTNLDVGDDLTGMYDVIISFNVLEHLHDPRAVLSNLKEHLAPNGHLLIEVPDTEARMETKHFHIAHITYFTKDTLRAMLTKAGFTVVEEQLCEDCKTVYTLAT